MPYLAEIAETMLKVETAKKPLILEQNAHHVVVNSKLGKVYLFLDGRGVEMSPLTAHDIGYTIAMKVPVLAPDEMIVLIINGEKLELLPDLAQRISTALLRKADDADDWQLNNGRKLNA